MDFGIARAIADTSSAMTQTAAVIGTAQYLSPEQARGETVDARSDIYSTGCLLYELLTGRPPFIGDSPVSVAYQHVREEARPPSQLNPDVSTTIDNIVAKSLAKRVEDRYQSAADMRKDIDRAIAGLQVDAPTAATVAAAGATQVAPAAPPIAPTSGGGARRALPPEDEDSDGIDGKWWGIGVVAVLLLAALAYGIYKWTEPPPEIPQVAVTDVTGMPVDTATRALENDKFVVDPETEQRPDNKLKAGLVIATDPPAKEKIDKGSTVKLIVSSGPEKVTIPSFDGFSYNDAKKVLEGKGLKVKKAERDSTLAKNQVINSDPPAGETADFGSTVTLLVSKGQSTVPNVVGLTKEEAIAKLQDADLKVSVVEDPASPVPQNQVAAQDKPEGTTVAPGTTVTITVSTNPAIPPTEGP
jgi:serine/threonine-protein kinase